MTTSSDEEMENVTLDNRKLMPLAVKVSEIISVLEPIERAYILAAATYAFSGPSYCSLLELIGELIPQINAAAMAAAKVEA